MISKHDLAIVKRMAKTKVRHMGQWAWGYCSDSQKSDIADSLTLDLVGQREGFYSVTWLQECRMAFRAALDVPR